MSRRDNRGARSLHCRGYDVKRIGERDLRHVFSEFGRVIDVYLPKDYFTKELRGFAYIQFEREMDADNARIKLDRTDIFRDNRPVSIMWAAGDRKTPTDMRRLDIERDNPHARREREQNFGGGLGAPHLGRARGGRYYEDAPQCSPNSSLRKRPRDASPSFPNGNGAAGGHGSRSRSRSPYHSRRRISSPKYEDRERDRDYHDRERERDRDRDYDRRDDRDRDRRGDRDRDRDRDFPRDRDDDRSRETRHRDRDDDDRRDRDRDRKRDYRDRDREMDRDERRRRERDHRERDREHRDRDYERGSTRDRESDRQRQPEDSRDMERDRERPRDSEEFEDGGRNGSSMPMNTSSSTLNAPSSSGQILASMDVGGAGSGGTASTALVSLGPPSGSAAQDGDDVDHERDGEDDGKAEDVFNSSKEEDLVARRYGGRSRDLEDRDRAHTMA